MRPAKAQFGRHLLAVLERAQELLEMEVAFNRDLDLNDYRADHILPRLAFPSELENVRQLITRIRGSGLTR